jgi:hypothetical protein
MTDNTAKTLLQIIGFIVMAPFVLLPLAYLGFGLSIANMYYNIFDSDRARIRGSFSHSDISFGGDEKALLRMLTRLRSITASAADGRTHNRSLSVALVETLEQGAGERRAPTGFWRQVAGNASGIKVSLDLAKADKGALLVVTNTPIRWTVASAKAGQTAKIAFEGPAAFDVENAHPGLIAGFRIGAFGSSDSTEPQEASPNASSSQRLRFCESMKSWVRHFDVNPAEVRVWRLYDPTSIRMFGAQLTAAGGKADAPEYLTSICPQYRIRGY